MPQSCKPAVLAALALLATELRHEQGAAPGSETERAAIANRNARAAKRGKLGHLAAPGLAHQPQWDAGAVILHLGPTRYIVRASFESIEALATGLQRLPARLFTHPAGFTIHRDRRPLAGPDPALAPAIAAAIEAARPAKPQRLPAPPATDPAPTAPQPWPDPDTPAPLPWPDPAKPPPAWTPEPEPESLAARRSAAARKAMANRDRFAAARKAAATRAANKGQAAPPPAPPPVPPAFADYVSDRLGTRRWIIGPARRGERALADRVIDPAWHGELRRAWRLSTGA